MPNRSQTSRSSQFDGHQHVHELEAGLARPEIGGRHLGEKGIAQVGPVTKDQPDGGHIVSRHVERRLQIDAGRALEPRPRDCFLQQCDERGRIHYESFCCAIFRWSWTMP
jgi:hypothetical protein